MNEALWSKMENQALLKRMASQEEVVWINKKMEPCQSAMKHIPLTMADINDAEARLLRFAPFLAKCFPETAVTGGIIESALVPIPAMQKKIAEEFKTEIPGKFLLKQDSHLPISGSVKSRGGIYEVLKYAEELAVESGKLKLTDNYEILASPAFHEFFGQHKIQVGSTGNLGLSIGIMSAALGFHVIVHMSADAKQWKKNLLREKGAEVREYDSDFSQAVGEGRKNSDADPSSYFIDDENSKSLFLGYSVAAKRVKKQFDDSGILIDNDHPLFLYIPCGVGGAPGGVTFGFKQVFGDNVHVFFVEPVMSPCMLSGMASGLQSEICVKDLGLSGLTHADGLAVGRPSGFVGGLMDYLLSGIFTIHDAKLYDFMRDIVNTESMFLEPSACAAFIAPARLLSAPETQEYIQKMGLSDKMPNAIHISWATGGNLVPEDIRKQYMDTYL